MEAKENNCKTLSVVESYKEIHVLSYSPLKIRIFGGKKSQKVINISNTMPDKKSEVIFKSKILRTRWNYMVRLPII